MGSTDPPRRPPSSTTQPSPAVLPRLRNLIDSDPPILAPLVSPSAQTNNTVPASTAFSNLHSHPPILAPLHTQRVLDNNPPPSLTQLSPLHSNPPILAPLHPSHPAAHVDSNHPPSSTIPQLASDQPRIFTSQPPPPPHVVTGAAPTSSSFPPLHSDAPVLAPLHSRFMSGEASGSTLGLNTMRVADDTRLPSRPLKRLRLTRPMSVPSASSIAVQHVSHSPLHSFARQLPTSTDSNSASAPDDRAGGIRGRHTTSRGYPMLSTNSSSPAYGEHSMQHGRNETLDMASNAYGEIRPSSSRNIDEAQSNDWVAVVDMYTTGRGTEDGVALKNITKGDGRRVSDRKLLEKRRTIGKTYEWLGPDRFEAAIGYKWENGVRRKQKMYRVISRCRVVNAMRKGSEHIPNDSNELSSLIDRRIAEKEALKEASKTGAGPSGGRGAGHIVNAMGHGGFLGFNQVEPDGQGFGGSGGDGGGGGVGGGGGGGGGFVRRMSVGGFERHGDVDGGSRGFEFANSTSSRGNEIVGRGGGEYGVNEEVRREDDGRREGGAEDLNTTGRW